MGRRARPKYLYTTPRFMTVFMAVRYTLGPGLPGFVWSLFRTMTTLNIIRDRSLITGRREGGYKTVLGECFFVFCFFCFFVCFFYKKRGGGAKGSHCIQIPQRERIYLFLRTSFFWKLWIKIVYRCEDYNHIN